MKLAALPNSPAKLETPNWLFNTIPIGAARLVTNDIIPKRSIIMIMATILPLFFF
jgi:hypothetical protein